MEIVNLINNVKPPLRRRLCSVVSTRWFRRGELHPEPDQTYDETNHQSPECSGFIGPGPEYGQQIHSADGRSEVTSDGLDVVEQLRSLAGLDDRDPNNGDSNKNQDEYSPNQQQLHLARVGAEPGVDVHGEDGGGGVEDGGEGGHEGGQHHRQHHAPGSSGHQLRDQLDEGNVGAATLAAADLETLVRVSAGHLVSEQHPGRHPGEDHDEEREQLEVPGQDTGSLGVSHVLAGESSLNNHLVAAPIPDTGDGQTKDHARPGQIRVLLPQQVHGVPRDLATVFCSIRFLQSSDLSCGIEIFINQTFITSNILMKKS